MGQVPKGIGAVGEGGKLDTGRTRKMKYYYGSGARCHLPCGTAIGGDEDPRQLLRPRHAGPAIHQHTPAPVRSGDITHQGSRPPCNNTIRAG
eukprot:1196052-Prorocentrum_minimum.AAC.6